MRILVNYDKAEKERISALGYILRQMNIEAMVTSSNLSISELMGKAKTVGVDAIVCANDQTLRSLVPGDKPTLDAWRGSRLNFDLPVIIANKLAHIHTVPYGSWLWEQDLNKLRHIHKKPMPFRYTKLLTTDMFSAAFARMEKAEFLAYDIEAKTLKEKDLEGGETYITCASWTAIYPNGSLETFMLPLVNYDGDY